ncbi:hypothetical protein [Carboxylicivirga sp. M1479]|uniref:hypothetical protein n=1 Tax=Carboxylicivirga sp. M1479 TaxID=2594476 RepID=UPI001177388B|nr:hypothetical protein [Carboxylicivirga sp. M1479]TRX72025.1 hypothetical protein FNN09_03195 [Carboxylicivirga sp. M1479]
MRKVSAHYYLRSDGSFGKRPIISLDCDGRIASVVEKGDDFKEEPSLEYYPGILIPGFVASIGRASKSLSKLVIVNGVLRLQQESELLSSEEYLKPWEILKQLSTASSSEYTLGHYLLKHTFQAAQLLEQAEWGVLRAGANPGLLVLQNIDLRNMALSPQSSFKIIQR